MHKIILLHLDYLCAQNLSLRKSVVKLVLDRAGSWREDSLKVQSDGRSEREPLRAIGSGAAQTRITPDAADNVLVSRRLERSR